MTQTISFFATAGVGYYLNGCIPLINLRQNSARNIELELYSRKGISRYFLASSIAPRVLSPV